MNSLSIEVLHYLVFNHLHDPLDIYSLAMASKSMYRKIQGEIWIENEYEERVVESCSDGYRKRVW